jgi:serine protease AprX
MDLALYCSSFGFSADGVAKPELIALARGIAAPILPETPAFRRAEALSRLASAPDRFLPRLVRELAGTGNGFPSFDGLSADAVRYWAEETLREEKVVATHYQHVDGTSFAAPIVSSVVAQMLEANPALTPAAVKRLLIATAERIPGAPSLRQGWGVLSPRLAVETAEWERHGAGLRAFDCSRARAGRVVFVYHDDSAERVAVAGSFNDWDPSATPLARETDGSWRADVPVASGRQRYKFVVDGSRWIEDPGHGAKESDPYGGFDSMLVVP